MNRGSSLLAIVGARYLSILVGSCVIVLVLVSHFGVFDSDDSSFEFCCLSLVWVCNGSLSLCGLLSVLVLWVVVGSRAVLSCLFWVSRFGLSCQWQVI